jgi:hypothetical protein
MNREEKRISQIHINIKAEHVIAGLDSKYERVVSPPIRCKHTLEN